MGENFLQMSSTNFVKLMELRNEDLKEEVYIEKPK
jgi:hypothetical protein